MTKVNSRKSYRDAFGVPGVKTIEHTLIPYTGAVRWVLLNDVNLFFGTQGATDLIRVSLFLTCGWATTIDAVKLAKTSISSS